MSRKSEQTFRIFHRYLGFFLAGIMAVYAISGIVLTFRNTDYLKNEVTITRDLSPGLTEEGLAAELRMRGFRIEQVKGEVYYFANGTYDRATGRAEYTQKQLPYLLEKMNKLHKMHSGDPLFFLGIFFGVALLFFSVSAFFMFRPNIPIYRNGLYAAAAGFLLAVILLLV